MQTPRDVDESPMRAFTPRHEGQVQEAIHPPSVGSSVLSGASARVFIEGSMKLVPVNELEPAPSLTEMIPNEFRTALTQRRLEHPLTDQLLSYKASRTDLYYHQFLPVKKMLESPDQRLLIADEVGTGKTIEAGLIWAELESRAVHGLENVWVVCPKSLVGKWQDEMLQRFDFRLEPLSAEGLRQALVLLERDGVLPPRFAKSIVNLELVRAEEHMARLGQTGYCMGLRHLRRGPPPAQYRYIVLRTGRLGLRAVESRAFPHCHPAADQPIGHRSPYGGFGCGRGGRPPLARRADALGHGIERLDPLGQASAAGLAARDGRRSGEVGCGWTGQARLERIPAARGQIGHGRPRTADCRGGRGARFTGVEARI